MKYRCDQCDEDHDIGDLTINIGDEGHKVIEGIDEAVMGIVEKRAVPYELLMYALAAYLEQIKQVGLKLGNKSHRIGRRGKKENELLACGVATIGVQHREMYLTIRQLKID